MNRHLLFLLLLAGIGCVFIFLAGSAGLLPEPFQDLSTNITLPLILPFGNTTTISPNVSPDPTNQNQLEQSDTIDTRGLSEFFHYSSGSNNMVATVLRYSLADSYYVNPREDLKLNGTTNPPVSLPTLPTRVLIHAPAGKKFLFIRYSILNLGQSNASIPMPSDFVVTGGDNVSFYPDENKSALADYSFINEFVTGIPSPHSAWFGVAPGILNVPVYSVPFTVPDTFNPVTAAVTIHFTDTQNATWQLYYRNLDRNPTSNASSGSPHEPRFGNGYYRYFSGTNEIIANVTRYEIFGSYDTPTEVVNGFYGHTFYNPHPAPFGTRFLLVHVAFVNLGTSGIEIPPPSDFAVLSSGGLVFHPDEQFFKSENNPSGRIYLDGREILVGNPLRDLKGINYIPGFVDVHEYYLSYTVPAFIDSHSWSLTMQVDGNHTATWKLH